MKPLLKSPIPPPQLVSIQNWLQTAITSGSFNSKEASQVITRSSTRSSDERLATYLDDFWPRCFESLTDDYPRTARALGNQWEPLCKRYLRTYPSSRFTLYYLGQNLPRYVSTLNLNQWINDLISLEWALLNASIEEQLPYLEINATTPLSLQPHVTLLHLKHPIIALVTEKPCKKQSEYVIVYGGDDPDQYTTLPPLIARVFEHFKQGHSLSATFDLLSQSNLSEVDIDHISSQIQHWMSVAIQRFWITPSATPKE